MIRAEQLHARIMDELDMTREVGDEELTQLIYQVLSEASREEHLSLAEKTALGKDLFNAFRKLDLLQEFLEDDEITEIMINGTEYIFYEKNGRLYQSDRRFVSREKLEDVIQQIVSGANRLVNEASPIVDARLADGSRVNVVLAPVALNGPVVTIRKIFKRGSLHGTVDGMGIHKQGDCRVFRCSGKVRLQYLYQWRYRFRQNHFLKCIIAVYTQR